MYLYSVWAWLIVSFICWSTHCKWIQGSFRASGLEFLPVTVQPLCWHEWFKGSKVNCCSSFTSEWIDTQRAGSQLIPVFHHLNFSPVLYTAAVTLLASSIRNVSNGRVGTVTLLKASLSCFLLVPHLFYKTKGSRKTLCTKTAPVALDLPPYFHCIGERGLCPAVLLHCLFFPA